MQRDGGQPRAAGKGTVVDARDAAGNVHGGQRRGLIKRGGADLPHTRRNGHAGDVRPPERRRADDRYRVGDDRGLARAPVVQELPLPDEEVRGAVVIQPLLVQLAELSGKGADAVAALLAERAAMQEGVLAADGDVGQILAFCEGAPADLRHAGGDIDLLQVIIIVKRIFADGFQALRQDDLAQLEVGLRSPIIAVVERVVRNVGHGVRERDLAHEDIGRAVALLVVEALDADDGVSVDNSRHHDLRFTAGIGCDLNGVARDEAVRIAVAVLVRQLFLPERVRRRQQRQQHGQRQQQGKQSSFHGRLRMQASFLSQD